MHWRGAGLQGVPMLSQLLAAVGGSAAGSTQVPRSPLLHMPDGPASAIIPQQPGVLPTEANSPTGGQGPLPIGDEVSQQRWCWAP